MSDTPLENVGVSLKPRMSIVGFILWEAELAAMGDVENGKEADVGSKPGSKVCSHILHGNHADSRPSMIAWHLTCGVRRGPHTTCRGIAGG